jgi:NADH:ubiquinone oxidoreductase subunit H
LSFHLLNEKVFILSNWRSILPIIGVTLITILAETNRAPFDLTEGESELVRGFNTEFSSTLFVLLFLGEYSFIILFSVLFSLIVLNSFFWWFFFLMVFLWVRACFPRKRYDFLIYLMWVILFPFACWIILFYLWIILF